MADVETKFLNERVVVEIRFANEIVDFPFSIRSRPSSGLDHGGSLKIKIKVNFNSNVYLILGYFSLKVVLLNQDGTFFYQLDQNMTKIGPQIYIKFLNYSNPCFSFLNFSYKTDFLY